MGARLVATVRYRVSRTEEVGERGSRYNSIRSRKFSFYVKDIWIDQSIPIKRCKQLK